MDHCEEIKYHAILKERKSTVPPTLVGTAYLIMIWLMVIGISQGQDHLIIVYCKKQLLQ